MTLIFSTTASLSLLPSICSLIFQGKGYIETYWLLGRNFPNALEADIEPMMDIDEVVASTAMPPIIM